MASENLPPQVVESSDVDPGRNIEVFKS